MTTRIGLLLLSSLFFISCKHDFGYSEERLKYVGMYNCALVYGYNPSFDVGSVNVLVKFTDDDPSSLLFVPQTNLSYLKPFVARIDPVTGKFGGYHETESGYHSEDGVFKRGDSLHIFQEVGGGPTSLGFYVVRASGGKYK